MTTAVTSATLNGKTMPTQHIDTVGDIQFDGAKVSLTTQVVTPGSTTPPASEQIAIGRDYYVREGNLPDPSGRWSKGTTKQAYPYLGVVEPAGLANAQGPVRVVGSKMIDGQRTTEYALRMAGAIHALSAPGGRTVTLKVRPFTLDIWLDMEGRIVATRASDGRLGEQQGVGSKHDQYTSLGLRRATGHQDASNLTENVPYRRVDIHPGWAAHPQRPSSASTTGYPRPRMYRGGPPWAVGRIC